MIRRKDWIYYSARFVLRSAFYLMGYKISVEGADIIPEKGAGIIVFNHVSMWDPLILMRVLERPINSVGKKELFKMPLWSQLIYACGVYPIDRFNQNIGMNLRAVKYSRNLLKLDEIVSLAPGATRASIIGKIHPKMLLMLEDVVSCPVYACGIHYSDPKDFPRRGSSIELCFSEYNIRDEGGELKEEDIVAQELGQLLSELSGLPFDPSFDALSEKYLELMK